MEKFFFTGFLEKIIEQSIILAKTEADNLPVMGLEQAVHLLEKSSPKHSAQ